MFLSDILNIPRIIGRKKGEMNKFLRGKEQLEQGKRYVIKIQSN